MLQFIRNMAQWPSLRRFFNQIPGPFLAKLTRLWKLYHLLVGSYTKRVNELHRLYGTSAMPLVTHHHARGVQAAVSTGKVTHD